LRPDSIRFAVTTISPQLKSRLGPTYLSSMPAHSCGTLRAMRRAQAILVMIALLSVPLSLLARSVCAVAQPCCNACCLPHHASHSSGTDYSGSHTQKYESKFCEHGAAGRIPNCAMNCGHASSDYGLWSPIAPTKPSNLTSILRLNVSNTLKLQPATQKVAAGFLATPFQPPRA
jgi:hypothetical protein